MLEQDQSGPRYNTFLYPLSCFFYAIAGTIRIYQKSKIDGINLIIQSFISYKSDVDTLGESSIWHPIDRISATYTCIYHFYSIVDHPLVLFLNLGIFCIGYLFLLDSQIKYSRNDATFEYSHIIWHFVSIPMAISCANNFLSFNK
jgi:hypothetical protein